MQDDKWTATSILSDIGRNDGKCGLFYSPAIFTDLNIFVDAIVSIVAAYDGGATDVEDLAASVDEAFDSVLPTVEATLNATSLVDSFLANIGISALFGLSTIVG